ncbi:MAG: sodium-translocating pyrophosphatase [Clostridia bacterium]|nr:sodium-translocating pyrophosphatase [Clostridia bacterium]MBR4054419.1 sodium-translocating pyrophosphatase [Clostridia bacterium]
MEPTLNMFYGISILVAAIAFLFAAYLYVWVKRQAQQNKRITEVARLIREGANTFMKREYKILAIFASVIAVLILVLLPKPIWSEGAEIWKNVAMAVSYICGTVLSAIAGKLGLVVASLSNGRSAEAAKKGIKPAFLIGFRGGSVMGLIVVGCAVLGVSAVLMVVKEASILLGFSFGASSLALFAKAGGGIFTKTADVAADLTGKVELGIAEDDPRNPAVIADNVGDNVGDVAGMGADLFDSNVAAMTSALVIAQTLGAGEMNVMMVLCYAALGLLASILGIATARITKKGTPTKALNSSTYVTSALFLAFTAGATALFGFSWHIWACSATGLIVGVIIGLATDYFTDDSKPIVKKCAGASKSGPAFTILSGVSYGFLSALPAMIGIAVSALVSYKICGTEALIAEYGANYPLFGISMAAVGMLSIVAMIISNDAYGPIVDNARGLAEMGGLGEDAIRVADELDSAGNTVKAVTKGFSIGAAGLTVISLLGTFMSEANAAGANIAGFDIMDPTVFFGVLIGAAIPAVFSAMLILGVDKNAQKMVKEIHRQFDTIPGLKEGKEDAKPEYDKCIDVATTGALRELIPAGLVAILATIGVGFIGGPAAVGGFLLGNIVSGLLLSLFMSNAGGLWDNSKKYVEAGNEGGKGSEAHKAAVIGDTVGDPFKDTAGPSINTQITVVSLVASLLSAIFVQFNIFG